MKPDLRFAPPGLKLTSLEVKTPEGGGAVVSIPWIGQYVAAIYRYAIPVAAVLATVIIMIAGIAWMVSGGVGQIATAKQWIQNAIVGLILLLGSYVILSTVNPDLVSLNQIQVRLVSRIAVIPEEEPEEVAAPPGAPAVPPPGAASGTNIIGGTLTDPVLIPDLQAAAVDLQTAGFQLLLRSSFRSVAAQEQLIRENCTNPPGSATCNPKPGRPTTCMLRNGPQSCPHTTGRAVDAWGAKDGKQCITQADCLRANTACRANPCQAALITAMRRQGFCNLNSEPWHFEKPRMSPGCS